MEINQQPTNKKEEKIEAAGSMEEEDRISQLLEPILHHILSLLPQKHAIQTCVLSKSWRYLGLKLPKIEIRESFFSGRGITKKFMIVVENTLQRYVDQDIPIQELILGITWHPDSETTSLLHKWIPIVINNMGVKTLKLLLAYDFPLPSVAFQADFLEELYLDSCKLSKTFNSTGKVFKRLRTLSLRHLLIEDETFEKIMSSCPSIQHLVLDSCKGLSTVKVNEAHNLKLLYCCIFTESHIIDSIEIDDSAPLETIRIKFCKNWHNLHNNFFFPGLKSLYLWVVHLPTDFLNNISSNNCPCLEELQLHFCSGISEFKLSNRSIKRLIICVPENPIEVAVIDAPNMIYFEYKSNYLPSISFVTTSREWKSSIWVWTYSRNADVLSAWLRKLHEFLKALSQSQISLYLSYIPLTNYNGDNCEPVVIEHLFVGAHFPSYQVPALLNRMFRICRPRYIGLLKYESGLESQHGESIWKTLVNKGKTRQCDFWQQYLEESSIQVSDKNANEWHAVQVCEFSNNEEIRFRLKWRD